LNAFEKYKDENHSYKEGCGSGDSNEGVYFQASDLWEAARLQKLLTDV